MLNLCLAGALAVAWGCRPLPKPAELLALEQLRQRSDLAKVRQQQGALVKESDDAHGFALAAWSEGDLRAARDFSLVSQIKLRMAATAGPAKELQARVKKLKGELQETRSEYSEVQKELLQVEEMVQVYEDLAVAQANAREKKMHVSEVQQEAQADVQLGQARLELKMAELMNAETYAPELLAMARGLMERAVKELEEKKKPTEAAATARLATEKAQQAVELSRPRYNNEQSAVMRRAQNQALGEALSSLASTRRGISARLVTRGGSPQLVLPITSLFKPNGVKPLPARRKLLDQIAEQLKAYPDFHVVIRGHTSHLVPARARAKISRARARKVADHLIAAGLDPKRLMVRGEGAARLMLNKNSSVNDRVEICILLR